MTYQHNSVKVSKLSVIGAGQIGPDIMLHFAKAFALHDVKLVLVDISAQALQGAQSKIEKKIQKGLESGAFSADIARTMRSSISYTGDYEAISGSDIVLEAATENENVKDGIFKTAEAICTDKCLFFSNSSHMRPEVIFKNIRSKSRCLVTHYFFPADRNPVVEIVPGEQTDKAIVEGLFGFYKAIGKAPLIVKSSYGYAIDPIFEGLCQTAIMCLEEGHGNEKQIDKIACETLGLGVGPFTALNLTGGNPITDHGLDEMGKELMPWFKSPSKLKEAVKNNLKWQTAAKGEEVSVPIEAAEKIAATFRGAYFGLASYIIDRGIVGVSELDMACKLALAVNPPFTMMNQYGVARALDDVRALRARYASFSAPASLEAAVRGGEWGFTGSPD